MRELTEKLFLADVKDHQMQILLDNGVYRHLRFKSTGAHPWNQWFDIVTWPGYLAYSGDMGCFVFSRLNDMFEFFRYPPRESGELYINLSYWAEKLQAVDRDHCNNSETGYSEDLLRKRVEEQVKEWIETFQGEYDSDEEEFAQQKKDFEEELREAIDDMLGYAADNERDAHAALRDFSAEINGQTFEFSDTWEWDLREYTLRFVWCCYALAWSIQKYDLSIKQTEESNATV